MDDRNPGTNQGGQGQPSTSRPGTKPPGTDAGRERGSSQSDKPSTRPTPSGVPNEGRGMVEAQGRDEKPAAPAQSKYRGGRQGQGGVPNPDDADDDKSAGSFRGRADAEAETAAQLDSASDAEPDDVTDGDADEADNDDEVEEQGNETNDVTEQSRNDTLNSQPRNPE